MAQLSQLSNRQLISIPNSYPPSHQRRRHRKQRSLPSPLSYCSCRYGGIPGEMEEWGGGGVILLYRPDIRMIYDMINCQKKNVFSGLVTDIFG